SSFRFLRYLTLGTIAFWWVLTDLVGLKQAAWRLWLETMPEWTPAGRAVFLVCFWIPPMAVLILCQALFEPVYLRIREIHWSKGELATRAALGLGASLVPLLFVVGGVLELTSGADFKDFALCFALAAAFLLLANRALRKQLELTPNALTTGELRDRAFQLAGRIGVKLRQIYLLPPGKSRMANAFARSGNNILFSEILLANLSKREVDAVVAHELSHLKKDHPRHLGSALMGGLALVAAPYFLLAPSPAWQPLFDILFVAVPLLTFYFVARRFEYAADAGSIKATGDPAAMITALVKTHHLNFMPLEWSKWSEKGMTHPSTVRRARAIGRAAEISDERVNQLLRATEASGDGSPEEHYAVSQKPQAAKVFSSEWKRQTAVRGFLAFGGLAVLLPALLLRVLAGLLRPDESWRTFSLALAVCLAATMVFANRAPFWGYGGLCRRLRAQLAARTVAAGRRDAVMVGMAPGSEPRIFESNYSWDMGCLLLAPDRLCYWGEETQFALRCEQILSIESGRGFPDWFPTRFLYIRWRSAPGKAGLTFNLRPAEVSSVLGMRRASRDLERRMLAWHGGPVGGESAPEGADDLPLPPSGEVTSASLAAARDPRQIFSVFLFTAWAAGLVAALFRLPLEWVAPIDPPADLARYAGISGWYAVLLSLLMTVVRFGPTWFARRPTSVETGTVPPPPVPRQKTGASPDPSGIR
ncbi:MAG TPA: M48 family metalloprotease, partial [Candidatus Acidoferrum sp.]|nr:M48 family metalloprotease [Candidatus Acidoferrum sp.]